MRHAGSAEAGGYRVIRRWMFNIAAGVSLLLCVMSLAHPFTVGRQTSPVGLQIPVPIPSDAEEIVVLGLGGLEWWEYTPWDKQWYLMSSSPVSAIPVAIGFAVLPMWWWLSNRARRRLSAERLGLCQSCGYNLTANTSGICPECGTPVPSKPEAVA
jgi:hypothetical protein